MTVLNNKNIALMLGLVLSIAGCQSKFADKSPDDQNTSGFTVDGQLKATKDLDNRLAQLEDSAGKIRKMIQAFRRVQSNKQGEDAYTQIDFLLDVNQELKKAPIQVENGKYVRLSKATLNIKGLSPECQVVETKLETLSQGGTVPTAVDLNGISVDGVVYSARTCHSNGQYLPIVTVVFASNQTSLEFNNDNIRKGLQDLITPIIRANSSCEMTVDAQSILSRVQCKNLTTKLSDSEKLVVENLVYDSSADIRLLLAGKIYGRDLVKATLKFTIGADGKVGFDVQKQP